MTRQEFETLVSKLEKSAAQDMGSYRTKVMLLSAAGYVYILFVLLFLTALVVLLAAAFAGRGGGAAIVKLGLVLGALALTVLRALWVRWPEPTGIHIERSEAPKLFEEVEAIRTQLRAPQVHRIFIDQNYNASMEQRPRLGIFGWTEGQMHIGLPLMHALSPAEFRAVLAHEMGHLSGNHGRMTGWIYRIRVTWMRLLQRLEEEGRTGAGIFTKFFQWYAPFFNAYSFVLARAQEYEADKCSAQIAGREATAAALMAVEIRGRFLEEEFWPDIWKSANESEQPPSDPYTRQRTSLGDDFPVENVNRWVQGSLGVKTGYVDTHPSLNDRLKALGVNIPAADWSLKVDRLAKPTAAEHFLGPRAQIWYRAFEKQWTSAAEPAWKARHEQVQEYSRRFAELLYKKGQEPLSQEEAWEFVMLACDLEGDDVALPVLKEILAVNPEHVSAHYQLGKILLRQGDSAGLVHLDTAMNADSTCTFSACALAEQFLREHGQAADAERYHERAGEFADLTEQAEKERTNISVGDTLMEHKLDASIVRQIRDHLRGYDDLKAAFLVQKSVKFLPERTAYVLGIVPNRPWYRSNNDQADTKLLNLLAEQAPLPAGTYIILLNRSKKLHRKIEAVPSALVYVK